MGLIADIDETRSDGTTPGGVPVSPPDPFLYSPHPNIVTSLVRRSDKISLPLYDLDLNITPANHGTIMWFDTDYPRSEQQEVSYLLKEIGLVLEGHWLGRNCLQFMIAEDGYLVPSTNYWHFYHNKPVEVSKFLYNLQALEEFGLLNEYWVTEAVRLGYATLRLPHIRKPAGPFDNKEATLSGTS